MKLRLALICFVAVTLFGCAEMRQQNDNYIEVEVLMEKGWLENCSIFRKNTNWAATFLWRGDVEISDNYGHDVESLERKKTVLYAGTKEIIHIRRIKGCTGLILSSWGEYSGSKTIIMDDENLPYWHITLRSNGKIETQ